MNRIEKAIDAFQRALRRERAEQRKLIDARGGHVANQVTQLGHEAGWLPEGMCFEWEER